MAVTNYGTLLKRAGVDVGEVVTINPPEILHEAVESTNHGSGGWRTFIPSKLKEVSEFSARVNWIPNTIPSGIMTDLTAGTIQEYSITFPTTPAAVWTFDAYVAGFKPEEIDAQSPETLGATITFRPTGDATIA